MAENIALFPGSFDPFTNGHLDIVRTASLLFDRVHIAIGVNSSKTPILSVSEREAIIGISVQGIPNVTVGTFQGLLVTYAQSINASLIVRGLRQSIDFEYEQRMATANKILDASLPTVFLTPEPENLLTSSTIVRDIFRYGGDVGSFVPEPVRSLLVEKQNSESK